MALHRGIDGPDGPGGQANRIEHVGDVEVRPASRRRRLGSGTLACPACDAPVAPGATPLRPGDPLVCPVCTTGGRVHEFLSLAPPSRPARVDVTVVLPRPRRRAARRD